MPRNPEPRPACYAFSTNAWQGPWMNRQQLLSRLGHRGWPVIYSTGVPSVWERNSTSWRMAPLFGRQYESDGVRVDIAGRFLPVWPSRPRYNDWVVARYCAALKRRGRVPRGREGIAYLFLPEFLSYAHSLGCRYLVYHAVDDYAQTSGWTREMERLQEAAVARADLVLATTEDTLSRLPAGGSAPRRVLHNGADVAAFASGPGLPCPEDLARIPHPRICYVGDSESKSGLQRHRRHRPCAAGLAMGHGRAHHSRARSSIERSEAGRRLRDLLPSFQRPLSRHQARG